jgi:hypothetical protein
MVTVLGNRTRDVDMLNVTLDAPEGTVTLEGTLTDELLLSDNATTIPPTGAALVRVTVPVADVPPITVVGLTDTEEREGGVTVKVADFVAPPNAAEIVAVDTAPTAVVVTEKVAVVAPAATVTLAGTVATEVLSLDNVTAAPPAGAGVANVMLPVEGVPPATLVGFKVIDEIW